MPQVWSNIYWMKKMADNIQITVKHNLCIGCGTCVATCPKKALTLVEDKRKGIFFPKIEGACSHCGVCLKVCPGMSFSKPQNPRLIKNNSYVGSYVKCYAGYAKDPALRSAGSSGGLITSLANFALEAGLVDGVLSTKMDINNPLRPVPFVAKNKADLLLAAGSKYCPVSLNASITEILGNSKNYLIVGMPCHLSGIKKAKEVLNVSDDLIFFSLCCNHTPTFNATAYLLRKMQVPANALSSIRYRSKSHKNEQADKDCKKFEYSFSAKLIDGSEKSVQSNNLSYWGLVFNRFFWPNRCIICTDNLGEISDITFMDAWLPEFSSEKLGTSLIIVRSEKGQNLIKLAIEKGVVDITEISVEKVVEAQFLRQVNRNKIARRSVYKSIFHVNSFSNSQVKIGLIDKLRALFFILMNNACQSNSLFSIFIVDYYISIIKIRKSIISLVKR